MSAASPATSPADEEEEFARNVLQNTQDIFWQPEIDRRGGLEVTGQIKKALAILTPGAALEVRFNEEFELSGHGTANRDVKAGETLKVEDIEDIDWMEPVNIDPDAGWIAYVALANGRTFLTFDFRRNLTRGQRLLALAHEYLDTATHALAMGHLGPCLDACHTTIELGVTSMMYTEPGDPFPGKRDKHGRRRGWLNEFTRSGNAPRGYHDALVELSNLRSAARYGDPELTVESAHVSDLRDAAGAVLEHAAARLSRARDRDSAPSSDPSDKAQAPG